MPFDHAIGTLALTVGGNPIDWYEGPDAPGPSKEETYNAVRTMTFYTTDSGIAFLDAVTATMTWQASPFLGPEVSPNLISAPSALSNAAWTKANCTITDNQGNDLAGNATLDEIVEASDTSQTHSVTDPVTITSGAEHAVALLFRVGTGDRDLKVILREVAAPTNSIEATVDVSGESVAAASGAGNSNPAPTCEVQRLGGGLYRLVMVGTLDACTAAEVVLILRNGADTYNGDGASSLIVGKVQCYPTSETETWFIGKVMAKPRWERSGDNGEAIYRVDCGCPIWTLMRSGRNSNDYAPDTGDDVVSAINSSYMSGFTEDLEVGNTIAPSFNNADPWSMLKGAAMQSGQLLRISYGSEIRLYDQGDEVYGLAFDRDSGAFTVGFADFSHEEHGELYANRIKVVGSGLDRTRNNTSEQSAVGVIEADPFIASGVTDATTLQRIGDAILGRRASRSPLPMTGSFSTFRNGVTIGDQITINYPTAGISSLSADVQRIVTTHHGGGLWRARVTWTDSLLDYAAALSERRAAIESWEDAQETGDVDPNDPDPPPDVPHSGPVPDPDDNEPVPSTDEVFVHVRYNEDNGRFRLVLRTAKATDVLIGYRIQFDSSTNLTVTRTLEESEAGEDVDISGSGSRKVVVASQVSGVNDQWTINTGGTYSGRAILRLNLSGGTGVAAKITLRGLSGFDTINRITFGNETIATDVPSGRPFTFTCRVDPLVEPGAVAQNRIGKQVADGDSYGDLYDDSSKTTKLTDNPNRRRTQNFDEYDGTNTRTPAQIVDRIDRANNTINAGGTGLKDGKVLGTGGVQTRSDGIGTGSVQSVDGSGRIRGDDFDGSNTRTRAQMIDGRDRAVTGLDASGALTAATVDHPTSAIWLSGTTYLDNWQNGAAPAKFEGGEIRSNTVDTPSINNDAIQRLKIDTNAVSGDKFVEGVIDEFQTMGSTKSDAQWDAITA